MSDYTGAVNCYNGTIKVGSNVGTTDDVTDPDVEWTNFFGGNFAVNGSSSTITPKLDTQNRVLDLYNVDKWNLATDMETLIDVDIFAETADRFIGPTRSGSGKILITGINILADDKADNLEILVSNTGNLEKVALHDRARTVYSPIYKYTVDDSLLDTDGLLLFSAGGSSIGGYNQSILASTVEAQFSSS